MTVPAPVPAFVTVSVRGTMNLAVTVFAASLVTVHVVAVGVVAQPVKPSNVEPAVGAAVSVTDESFGKSRVHVAPQLSPAGVLVTVPAPVPVLVTVSVGLSTNVAVTVFAASTVTVHVVAVGVVAQPVKPANVEPVPPASVLVENVAVSVTMMPAS